MVESREGKGAQCVLLGFTRQHSTRSWLLAWIASIAGGNSALGRASLVTSRARRKNRVVVDRASMIDFVSMVQECLVGKYDQPRRIHAPSR